MCIGAPWLRLHHKKFRGSNAWRGSAQSMRSTLLGPPGIVLLGRYDNVLHSWFRSFIPIEISFNHDATDSIWVATPESAFSALAGITEAVFHRRFQHILFYELLLIVRCVGLFQLPSTFFRFFLDYGFLLVDRNVIFLVYGIASPLLIVTLWSLICVFVKPESRSAFKTYCTLSSFAYYFIRKQNKMKSRTNRLPQNPKNRIAECDWPQLWIGSSNFLSFTSEV